MVLKRLNCPTCELHLGGYDEKAGTLVLDLNTHPAIAFFVDATDTPTDSSSEPPRSNVTISCPACGQRTTFEAVSIRFGSRMKKSKGPYVPGRGG